MSQISNIDSMKLQLNYDVNGNPVSVQMQPESHTVINNKISLNQIPDSVNQILIFTAEEYYDGKTYILNDEVSYNGEMYKCTSPCVGVLPTDTNNWVGIASQYYSQVRDYVTSLDVNSFRVDYNNGLITFHPSKEGKRIYVYRYFGKGIIMYPATRIYTNTNEAGDVVETIGELIEEGREAIETFKTMPVISGLKVKRDEVFDSVKYYVATTYTDITSEAGITVGTVSGDILDLNGDYLYTGKSTTFNSIYMDISTAKSTGGTMTFEYSLGSGAWGTLVVADGTNGLTVDGSITFTPPTDWSTDTVDGSTDLFWVRIGTTGGAFTTEPTVFLVVPNDLYKDRPNILEVYPNGFDTVPSLSVDRNGGVAMGYANASTYRLRVNGTAYFSSTVSAGSTISGGAGSFTSAITDSPTTTGLSHVGGVVLNAPVATTAIPLENSPVTRFSSQAWDGAVTKVNAMDIYVNPDSKNYTRSRLAVKNTTVNGVADTAELMNLNSKGNLNVLGRVEDYYDTFDSVQYYVGSTYTDITQTISTFGNITGDVLNVVGDYLYIGKSTPFTSAYFAFDTIMSSGTTRKWEYLATGSTWTTFVPTTDGTTNWSTDGLVTFTSPADWITGAVNGKVNLYWIRVGTVSGTFSTEPTLRFCLPNANMDNDNVLSNQYFTTTSLWEVTGDYAYTTGDFTFTYSTGSGTLRQRKENFRKPLKPNTWYRFKYVVGVSAPSTTLVWIGTEIADQNEYFVGSTTETDLFFKTNSNPQDFVIYTTATATSGFRLDAVSLMECVGGNIVATGIITASNLSGINTGDYIHPSNHSPSIILQDTNNRFVTDIEKITWGNKPDTKIASETTVGTLSYNGHIKSGATLYGGNTDPTGIIRLNYDGNFYATKLYSGALQVATITGTETLTSKTLTSPRIGTNILDTNGNELINFTATASAVNELTIQNAVTTQAPKISVSGNDTNIGLNLVPKGTGTVQVNGNKIIDVTGGTMTGILTAQSNTSYTTKQVRNVILSTSDAVLGSMADGDIWIKYV